MQVRYLYIFVLWLALIADTEAQTQEKIVPTPEAIKSVEVKLKEIDVTLSSDDVEMARIKAREIKSDTDKAVNEIELFIAGLETDADTTNVYIERLQKEKTDYQKGEINQGILELMEKEIAIAGLKRDVDNIQIQANHDKIAALQKLEKAYSDWALLLGSIIKMPESLGVTLSDQTTAIKNEADIAKGYIQAAKADLKEKETLILLSVKDRDESKSRMVDEEEVLISSLESLKFVFKDKILAQIAQEKTRNIISWHKAVDTQRVAILETRLDIARIHCDDAARCLKNTELNAAYLSEKVKYLEEKQKIEELKKKQAELEAAKKAEEVTQKVAEVTRAQTEKTLQETTRKSEEIAHMQMVTTSPAKKRLLELEMNMHKQAGNVAKKKDEFINESTQRYKDVTEYKKLETELERVTGVVHTIKEIDDFLAKLGVEIKRFSESIAALEGLVSSVKQEEKLVSDAIAKAYEEISKIEEDAAVFENNEQAVLAVEYAHKIAKSLDEQCVLVSKRYSLLEERIETKKNIFVILSAAKEKLMTKKAANVWTRVESHISVKTLQAVFTDLIQWCSQYEHLYGNVAVYSKSFVSYASSKRNTVAFWVRWWGLTALVAAFCFSRRYAYRWCEYKIKSLYESAAVSYSRTRLFPGLLIVFQKSLFALWLAVLSLSITAIFGIDIPFVKAVTYILSFFAAYRVLYGLVNESFGPEKRDRKLVTSLAYVSPTHLYKALSGILVFSLVTVSIIVVLVIYKYRTDVVELLWFMYRVGMLILLLWLATQKTILIKLLPDAESRFGRLIHQIIRIIYPVFVAFLVFLFTIRSLGYPILTYVLIKTCIKSFFIAGIAFWIWKYLQYRLTYIRDLRLKSDNIRIGTPEEDRFHAVTTLYRTSFSSVVSLITAGIIIYVWVRTFRDSVGSPAAPFLVQKIYGQVGTVLRSVGSGLKYRFTVGEDKYTTPIRIIIASVVLFISFFIARYVKKLLEEKLFYKLRMERGLRQTLSTLTRYAIIGIAALIGLNLAGIPLRSITIFAGAFGIGIGFGMQNIINNFVSGIILLFERPMRVGDVITLEDGTLGTIEKISARSTTIQTPDNISVTVPNSKFVDSKITNMTYPSAVLRGSVKVGVAYGSDIVLVKKCLLEIAKQNPNVKAYPEPFVRFSAFGDSALLFELYFWAADPGKRWFTQSELNFAIDEVFRKNNIAIAFPQMDIHIRSLVHTNNPDMPVCMPVQDTQKNARKTDDQGDMDKKNDLQV